MGDGWEDYTYWQRTDRALVKRINRLLDDALPDPTGGIGKPEALESGPHAPKVVPARAINIPGVH